MKGIFLKINNEWIIKKKEKKKKIIIKNWILVPVKNVVKVTWG